MNVLKKHLVVLGVGLTAFMPTVGQTAQKKPQETLDRPLKGFYLGLGTGMTGMKTNVTIKNTTTGASETAQNKLGNLTVPIQFSAGYEKTFKEVYVFGVEATYTGGILNDKITESFDTGAGANFSVTNSLRANHTFGLNVSFARKLEGGLTPYLKGGLVSTEFITHSSSGGINPPRTSWDVTKKERVFGMSAGFGAKYAVSRRIDVFAESLWTFYKSFATQNFSGVVQDNHSFKVDPLLYLFLIGIRLKF